MLFILYVIVPELIKIVADSLTGNDSLASNATASEYCSAPDNCPSASYSLAESISDSGKRLNNHLHQY